VSIRTAHARPGLFARRSKRSYGHLERGLVRRRHLATAPQCGDDLRSERLGIYRGEVLTIMEALADLRVDVVAIRRFLLEEDDEEEEEGSDGEV
jgi:hypothetical protein